MLAMQSRFGFRYKGSNITHALSAEWKRKREK